MNTHSTGLELGCASERAWALFRKADGSYVAREVRSFELLGVEPGSLYSRGEIERSTIGASVTFEAMPPKVTVGGLSPWIAVPLGILGAIGIGALFSSRDSRH